jgi:hypothetical protein
LVRAIEHLRHEARDHAMEHDAVIEAVIGQLDDALDMLRGQIGAQLDRHVTAVEGQRQRFGGIGHWVFS